MTTRTRRSDGGYIRFPRVAATVAAAYFVGIAIAVAMGRLAVAVLVVVGIASALAYLIYRADKRRAQRGDRRIPEQTLHVIAVFGGWPGALVAQWRLRHKNKKLSFQVVFWLTVVVDVAVIWALGSRDA